MKNFIRKISIFTLIFGLSMHTVMMPMEKMESKVGTGRTWDNYKKKYQDKFEEMYAEGINDAKFAEKKEVVKDLKPIVPSTPGLFWKLIDGVPHVLMVTFVPEKFMFDIKNAYSKGELEKRKMEDVKFEAWVSPYPEMKEFAKKHEEGKIPLFYRVLQRLGLVPPRSEDDLLPKRYFVEYWVQPKDLYRVCYDAEITDKECLFDPTGQKVIPIEREAIYNIGKGGPKHKEWSWGSRNWSDDFTHKQKVEKLRDSNYKSNRQSNIISPNPKESYPLTRLGYTYDWNEKVKNNRGVNEFMIKQGATVYVEKFVETNDYAESVEPKGEVFLSKE